MAQWYGINNFSIGYLKDFRVLLLGPESKQMFHPYIPEHLDYLVSQINLPNSQYFKSYLNVIEKMSVFPLYECFVEKKVRDKYYKMFRGSNSIRVIENAFNIRDSASYYEGALYLKICPLCIQEKGSFFLDREHQIQNNYICYKHHTRLKYYQYQKYKSYTISDFSKINYEYCITDDDYFNVRVEIAIAIHSIFQKKIEDSIDVIKAKLRKKLIEKDYLNNDFIFINLDDFQNDFKKFNVMEIDDKQLFHILFTTSKDITPVAYISLILFLFDSIDKFKCFIISEDECKRIYRYRDSFQLLYKPITNKKKTTHDYNIVLNKKNIKEFEVVGITDYQYIILKHKICGYTWPIHRASINDIKRCKICESNKKDLEYKSIVQQLSNGYEYVKQDPYRSDRIIILHNRCGKESSYTIQNFKNGQRCTHCKIIDNLKKKIYDLVGNEYILIKHNGSLKRSIFLHNDPNCLKEIHFVQQSFLKLKYCPGCGKEKKHIPKVKPKNINI